MFENVAFVWGENVSEGPLPSSPSVTVALWPKVLECASLRWRDGQMPDVSGYDLFLVNLFHTADSTHIAQIRAAKPEAVIVAMPDPSLELVLMRPEWMPMLEQMALADWIGGRTGYDCQVYGALLNKRTVHLPSPIGPTEWFAQFRDVAKEDYIIALDHPMDPYMSAHNVAALAAVQRETGMRVVYTAARESTKEYARLAGLEAEWHGHVRFPEFVEMTAKARISIDLYARHSYHRHAVVCAMVGTPIVASTWTHPDRGFMAPGIFDIHDAKVTALNLLRSSDEQYQIARCIGFEEAERFGFERSRARMQWLIGEAL